MNGAWDHFRRPGKPRKEEERQADSCEDQLNAQRVSEDRRDDKAKPTDGEHKRHSEDEDRNNTAKPGKPIKMRQREQIEAAK